jgi:anthranilate synthase component 2
MRVVMIDNYDSFTYNLVQYLAGLGLAVETRRNDELTAEALTATPPGFFVISPGPSDPAHAGVSLALIARCAQLRLPLFGVCLGQQAIGEAFGGKVVRAPVPKHGKLSKIEHRGEGVFRALPSPFTATRYHSLVVDQATLPDCLAVTATSADDGLVMGLKHKTLPIEGVQFHPESVLTEHGLTLLRNFAEAAAAHAKA